LGYAVMKNGGVGSWQQQRIFGWFRVIVWMEGVGGEVERGFA